MTDKAKNTSMAPRQKKKKKAMFLSFKTVNALQNENLMELSDSEGTPLFARGALIHLKFEIS